MDGSVSDPSAPRRGGDPAKDWRMKSCGGDARQMSDGSNGGDTELKPHSRGIKTVNLEYSMEPVAHAQHSEEKRTAQTLEATSPKILRLDQVSTTGHKSLPPHPDASILSPADRSLANLGCNAPAEHNKANTKPGILTSPDKRNDPSTIPRTELGVKPNTVDVSATIGYNPFYPFKNLGQRKHADASECGSTTSPLEESEPLKKWKQMKQNGFLSLSHGGIPLPKQQAPKPRKKKRDRTKKKNEAPKREQVSRFNKFTAPSGLLSGLDPGIIKHVRNSKQVHAIIEAMVRSEKHDGQIQHNFSDLLVSEGTKETNNRRQYLNYPLDSAANLNYPLDSAANLNYPLDSESPSAPLIPLQSKVNELNIAERRFHHENTSEVTSDYYNGRVALKLSSNVTMGSDNVSSASRDDLSNQENITSLSLKAATVASQWLELLQMDIRGRLTALRRSKKRARNAVRTEMPYILTTELPCTFDNDPSADCSTSDTHVTRWRSLFGQMDKALIEEANHLESWLSQVQEMQLHCERGLRHVGADACERGLRHVGADAFSEIGLSENSRSKNPDEMERSVMAAAASIYSTCNFMAKENVPCF